MRKQALLLAGFVLVALACPAVKVFGQAVYGNLIGTVTDASGAAVPGATVTITDTGRGATFAATTNESGNYAQDNLPPGDYKVTVGSAGFKTFVQENVQVSVGSSTRVDGALQLGEVTQNVTVSAAPPALATDRADVSTTLSSRQVEELPLLNRNFTSLELLLPGTSKLPFQHAAGENPQGGFQIGTNGQLFSGSNFMIDGTDNNDPVLGIIIVNPNLDSVGEFKFTSSNYDAEFAQAGGSVIQVEIKSGSNQIHGSGFEFLQNNVFEARDPFTEGLRAPGTPAPPHRGIPELRYNDFGGSIGGPIQKDKIFGFFDYEGTRRRIGGAVLTRVPNAAERSGDLSDLGTNIFDPTTGNPDGSGRTQFTGNIVPGPRIATQATNVLNLLPAPNVPGAAGAAPNYAASGAQLYDSNRWDLRVDHYLTEKLRYFGRYSYAGFQVDAPAAFGLFGGPQLSGFNFEGNSDTRNQNAALGFNYVFSPTLLTDFRFGATRYRVVVSSPDGNLTLADQVGIPGLNIPGHPDTFGLPDLGINGTGGFSVGFQCNCPLHETENVFQFVNNWTKTEGNHTIKWGADIRRAQNLRLPSDRHRSGVYSFDPGVTALGPSSVSAGGTGLASFLLGLPTNFNRFAQISTNQQDRQTRMFFFGQDTWRATTKLTVSYGLRWDTWFPDKSLHAGQGGRYDVSDNFVRIPGVGGISLSGDAITQYHNFSPRLGIAYALDPKTVVRAGYGRSYFQGTFGWNFNDLNADIYPDVVIQTIPQPSSFFPIASLGTAPPAPVFPTIPSNGLLPLPNQIGTPYTPANQKLPYVDAWNLSVERALTPNMTLSVAYVGNVGRHLNGGYNLNAAIPGPGTNFDLRRPLFARFGLEQGVFDKCDCESSNYHALQVKAQKRFSNGNSFLATYTFSKTLDFGEFGTPTDQYNTRLDYGPAVFDRASTFTFGHEYILPFGKGQRWLSDAGGVANALAGGWQWTGITTLSSGLPFSPGISNKSLNSDQGIRPDQIAANAFVGSTHDRNQWFNPAAFAVPGPFLFGDAARNSLRGPGLFTADWSLFKNFKLTERFNLQVRWENFNVFNHTNLGQPNSAVDSGTAGLITSLAAPPRNMQFGLHLAW